MEGSRRCRPKTGERRRFRKNRSCDESPSRGERTRVRARVLRRATHLPATCIIVVGVASWPPRAALLAVIDSGMNAPSADRYPTSCLGPLARVLNLACVSKRYDRCHLRARAREIYSRLGQARDWLSPRLSGRLYLDVGHTGDLFFSLLFSFDQNVNEILRFL